MDLAAAFPRDHFFPVKRAIAVAIVAAACAAAILQAPPIWVALLAVGLLVLCGSLVASNASAYWFAIFLAAIPFSITKLFYWDPDSVALIKRTYGIYINENLVPQMYLADLPLLALLALWAIRLLATRRSIVVPRGLVLIVGFMAWCAVIATGERAPLLGAAWMIYELKMIVIFLWFVNAGLSRRDVKRAIGVLLLSLLVQSGVTFYTYAAQTGENVWGSLFGARQSQSEDRSAPSRGSGAGYVFEEGSLRRGTGTIGTANLEAKYFVLILPFALVGALCARRPIERCAAGLVLLIGLGALYLTYSRGGLLTAGVALGAVPLLLARSRSLGWNRRTIATALALTATAVAAATPFLVSYLGSRPAYTQTRFDQIRYGLELWWRNPLMGVGINNFNLWVSPLEFGGTFAGAPIHNHYLRIAIETGAVGFALYFAFFAWVLRLAYRLSRANDPFVAATATALFAGLAGIAVYWLDDLFYDPIIRTQIWVSTALVVVLAQMVRAREAAPVVTG